MNIILVLFAAGVSPSPGIEWGPQHYTPMRSKILPIVYILFIHDVEMT
jgi:hypothetical protein